MISYLILVVQFLSLSFWIGGSIVLLLIVEPMLSHNVPRTSELSGVVRPLFKRFNTVFIANAILIGLTLFLQIAFLSHSIALKLRVAMTLVSLAMLIASYERFALTPTIERLRTAHGNPPGEGESSDKERLRRLHRRSVSLFSLNLFLGVGVVITLLMPHH